MFQSCFRLFSTYDCTAEIVVGAIWRNGRHKISGTKSTDYYILCYKHPLKSSSPLSLAQRKGDLLSGNAMSLEFVFYFGAPSGQVMASTVPPVPLEPRSSFDGAKLIAEVPCSTKVAPEHDRKNKGIWNNQNQ